MYHCLKFNNLNISVKTNTLVILAKSHNPTLVSDSFFKEAGIIMDSREINPNNKIITPALTQIQFLSGVNFNLDSERLVITGTYGKEPFEVGQKYCNALGFIKSNAIGINFDLDVTDYDFKTWFDRVSVSAHIANQIKFTKNYNNRPICNITVVRETATSAKLQINYHYQFEGEPLKDLDLDFVEEWDNNFDRTNRSMGLIFN